MSAGSVVAMKSASRSEFDEICDEGFMRGYKCN